MTKPTEDDFSLPYKNFVVGWNAAIEAAAHMCEKQSELWQALSGTGTNGYARERFGHMEDAAVSLAQGIRALPAPAADGAPAAAGEGTVTA